jgi:hypothetical protein
MRSAHWNTAIPHIQQWVLDRFEKAGKSLWDYIEYRVNLKDVGINPDNFFRELAPKIRQTRKDHWDPDAWWSAVNGRIYYMFHRAADKADRSAGKPRPRCWAEWPGPIPPRPKIAEPASSQVSEIERPHAGTGFRSKLLKLCGSWI